MLDSEENGTGTWVNINNTGTNPLVADTDGDGLLDGVETNGTIYISATNTGTDPHKKDTDGDIFSDFYESESGSNPLDIQNFSFPNPFAFYKFENTKEDSSNNNHSASEGGAFIESGAPKGTSPNSAIKFTSN